MCWVEGECGDWENGDINGLTLGEVALVNQAGYHVAVMEIIVVMRSKDIGWNHTSEHTSMLLMVSPE